MKAGAEWPTLMFAVAFLALGVFGLRAPRDTIVRMATWRTKGGLDGLRVVWFRTGGVVICLLALVMAGVAITRIVAADPDSPQKPADPFAPYEATVAEDVERRDAPGYAMPVALYTDLFWPTGDYFDDVTGIPGSADIVLATIYHPTHVVVAESAERVTVTAYVECEVPPGEGAAATPPASTGDCAHGGFERGPGVTLLPVDLAEVLGARQVVDGGTRPCWAGTDGPDLRPSGTLVTEPTGGAAMTEDRIDDFLAANPWIMGLACLALAVAGLAMAFWPQAFKMGPDQRISARLTGLATAAGGVGWGVYFLVWF